MQHTNGFLGFFYTYCLSPGQPLGLHIFRDEFSSFLRYIAFLKARGRGGDYMSKNVHTAVRHLHFLKATSAAPYSAIQLQQHRQQLTTLATLKYQLRKICHHKPFNYDALLDSSGWQGGAPAIIGFVEEEKQVACNMMKVRGAAGWCMTAGCRRWRCARGAAGVAWRVHLL